MARGKRKEKYNHYIIYRIINLVNGYEYTGQHSTDKLNDSYLGGGCSITKSIKEFGKINFKKEILFVFDNFDEMNEKEKELVTREYCQREDTYNIIPGGRSKFTYEKPLKYNLCPFEIQFYLNKMNASRVAKKFNVAPYIINHRIKKFNLKESYKSPAKGRKKKAYNINPNFIQFLLEGWTVGKISRELKVDDGVIYRIIKENNLIVYNFGRKKIFTETEIKDITFLLKYYTIYDVSKAYGVDFGVIKRIIKENNIKYGN
jgi:transposase-like protein